jgi:hypothetical protein
MFMARKNIIYFLIFTPLKLTGFYFLILVYADRDSGIVFSLNRTIQNNGFGIVSRYDFDKC